MNIYFKDGLDINFDLYAMLCEDAEEKRRAQEVERQMQQENMGTTNKNIFF